MLDRLGCMNLNPTPRTGHPNLPTRFCKIVARHAHLSSTLHLHYLHLHPLDPQDPGPPSTPPNSRSDPPTRPTSEHASERCDAGVSASPSLDNEEDGTQTTPKASASGAPPSVLAVPTLNLVGDSSDNSTAAVATGSPAQNSMNGSTQKASYTGKSNAIPEAKAQPPSFAVPSSPQRPTPSSTIAASTPSLMPPPPLPPHPPSAAAGLRVPPTASGLSSSTLAPTTVRKQASRKVVLEPGYSPLDWAARAANPKNQLRGAGLPAGLLRVTPSMLKTQNGRKGRDPWTSYQGKVYNISPYAPYHPGGKGELLRGAGKDSAQLFAEIHPWVNWEGILGECLVGILVSENDVQAENSLDAMD
ncbi:uncharacterized protein N7482_000602 [Penicillium canariense]|uniref:Cytochrome b5 heme-binding domain-containing protein n=1 Tax=Penicillium canariense TaxID=189055 RepID=A0A9W9LST1_9EURO|nr:uncharacterized protein N7482_000602 [Penicillium canariense]KAJ5174725.1 hypothetical protein N7482_000602 [Penicillium canariense]